MNWKDMEGRGRDQVFSSIPTVSGGNEENHVKYSHDIWPLNRDLDPGSSKYEAGLFQWAQYFQLNLVLWFALDEIAEFTLLFVSVNSVTSRNLKKKCIHFSKSYNICNLQTIVTRKA
jgi:hypothetical protein